MIERQYFGHHGAMRNAIAWNVVSKDIDQEDYSPQGEPSVQPRVQKRSMGVFAKFSRAVSVLAPLAEQLADPSVLKNEFLEVLDRDAENRTALEEQGRRLKNRCEDLEEQMAQQREAYEQLQKQKDEEMIDRDNLILDQKEANDALRVTVDELSKRVSEMEGLVKEYLAINDALKHLEGVYNSKKKNKS